MMGIQAVGCDLFAQSGENFTSGFGSRRSALSLDHIRKRLPAQQLVYRRKPAEEICLGDGGHVDNDTSSTWEQDAPTRAPARRRLPVQ
jgi:hypothetical protein